MALTYPIIKGTRFDVWDTDTNAFARRTKDGVESDVVNIKWPRADGMELEGKPDNIVMLERVTAPDPAYDPAIEKLSGLAHAGVDVADETSTYARTVVTLTQAELDAKAEEAAETAERDQLRTWYQTFKDGNATNLQAQKAIAWLIKQNAGLPEPEPEPEV